MRSPQERRNNRPNNQRRNNQSRMPVHSRQFESSGPSGKLKGTPKQLIDKYMSLARDYYSSGDDINAETCKQFAEHYSRLIGSNHNKSAIPSSHENEEKSTDKAEKENIKIEVVEKSEPKRPSKQVKKVEDVANIAFEQAEEEKPREEPKKRRGRPKKTEEKEIIKLPFEEAEEEKPREEPKKRRGRPKKIDIE